MLQISKPDLCADGSLNAAAQALVEQFMPFARKAASQAARRSGLSVEDLMSAACLGLTDAAPRFDPDLGYSFATYALRPVMHRLREECRVLGSVVKRPRPVARERDPTRPTPSVAAFRLSAEKQASPADCSLDAFVGEDGATPRDGLIAQVAESPEERVVRLDDTHLRKSLLAAALGTLTERERVIVEGRHGDDEPISLGTFANRFGISAERVRQIETKALDKIERHVRTACGTVQRPRTRHERQIDGLTRSRDENDNIMRHAAIGGFSLTDPIPDEFDARMRGQIGRTKKWVDAEHTQRRAWHRRAVAAGLSWAVQP